MDHNNAPPTGKVPLPAAIPTGEKSISDADYPTDMQVSADTSNKSLDMEKCLDSMENLLYKLTENLWPNSESGQAIRRKHHSPSRSSVDTFIDPRNASRRKSSRESPSRY